MSGRRVQRTGLSATPEPRPGRVGGSGSARPRSGGLGSGGLSSQERPAVLGRGEENEGGTGRPETGSQGRAADTQRLKAAVLISEVLALYGEPLGFSTYWRSVRCPFHDDRHASASYNDAIGQFFCHGCGVHGDIFDLVQEGEGISFPEAVTFIEGRFPR